MLLCLLVGLAATAFAQTIPYCDRPTPPSGQNIDYGIGISETITFQIAITSNYEEYGCILPFSAPVNGGYLAIWEPDQPGVLSDYVFFTSWQHANGEWEADMYLYSDVEGVPLVLAPPFAEVTETGAEGSNYAIYLAHPGDIGGYSGNNLYYVINSDTGGEAVPEPSTLLLAGAALLVVGLLKRKLA
jgi:hypothetical protein